MKRRIVFAIHRVAGLLSGLFILVMSFSGAVLVFHEELGSIRYPTVENERTKAFVSIDSCYNNLQRIYPGAQISNCRLPENPARPFIFSIYDSSHKNGTAALQVFIHPQTAGMLQTRSSKDNFVNWIRTLHNSLHLGKKGEWLLGFFALLFLLSIVTGSILYRKHVFSVLTFKKRVFSKKNLHQLIGVYALIFNLMIGITGFWMQRYVFKKEFYANRSYKPVLKASPSLFYSIDRSLKTLKDTFPEFTGYVVYFAQSKKGKTAIYGSRSTNSFIHSKKFADAIFLDSTGNPVMTAFVNEIDSSSRYDIINAQVHYGQYGGVPVKIIYSLLGLTGGLLSVTGFLLWLKRRKRIIVA